MPAFGMSEEEIRAVRAFLTELDRPDLGIGELRLGDPDAGTSPQAAFEAAVLDASPRPDVVSGFESFRSGICSTCHFPFQVSVVLAPDLSTVTSRLDETELREVLVNGRPERGMPPPAPAFSETQLDQVVAYLNWLGENRGRLMADWELRQSARDVDWSRLPWWEYR